MGALIYILLGWGLSVAGCYAAGALLLSRLGSHWTREESIGLRFIAGAGIYSCLVFALGIAHLYYRGVFIALPLIVLAAAWRTGALPLPAERLPALPLLYSRLLWLTVPFIALYLSNTIAPEASPDGASYHLGLVAHYYRERAMIPVPTNMYAALSQGTEMLFLAAYSIGRHSAAAMVHCTYLFALPWMILCFGRRYAQPAAATAAALLIFCAPVIGIDGISAYNDLAAAALVFTLFLTLLRMEEVPHCLGLIVLAGVLGGSAFGVKYTLAPSLILAALWIVWLHRKASLRPLLVLSAISSVFILPWVIRNTIWWHNPLAPFFNNWFPNPYIQYWFEITYRKGMAIYSLDSLREIPLEVTVIGGKLNGLLGPVFLLTPLALLSLRSPLGRRLLLAAAFALSTYPSNIGTRFLIPAAPFLALALTLPLARLPWLPAVLALLHAVLSWPAVIPTYANQWAWRLDKITWKEALRLRSDENYIMSLNPGYGIARRIEEVVPPGRRVFGFSGIPEAYTSRDFLVSFQSSEGLGLRDIFYTPLHRDTQPSRHVTLQVPAGRHTAVRVVQNRDQPDGQWSIAEMHVRHGDSEIQRSPHWRLRANPSLHDVQNAFDGSYVTRWITERGRAAGMYIEADFGREELLDRVVLHIAPDQPLDTFHIEVPGPNRTWVKLETTTQIVEVTTPVGLRRAAIEELLRRNIHYLVTSDSDFGVNDIVLNRAVWGLEELGNIAGFRLYRLLPRDEFLASRKAPK